MTAPVPATPGNNGDGGWVRQQYGVPASIGRRIRYCDTRFGVITGFHDGLLLVRFDDGAAGAVPVHPTWRVEYLGSASEQPQAPTTGPDTAHPTLNDRDHLDQWVGGVRDALHALDGHNIHDTAHDRVRRLLACAECDHPPEDHENDGRGICRRKVNPPRFADTCPCIEWEAR